MPFAQRKKLVERSSKKKAAKDTVSSAEIVVGATVCMRSAPLYNAGATAFAEIHGVPKIGQLLEAAWTLGDSCRFRIKHPGRFVNF